MNQTPDFRPLFADYANGEISPVQLQTLDAALRSDADLRRQFIEYMNVDSVLGDIAALSEAESAAIEDDTRTLPSGHSTTLVTQSAPARRTYRMALMVGTIVVAAVLPAAIRWIARPNSPGDAPVATLVTEVDAVLLRVGQPWTDADLTAGLYHLQQGLLHLQFAGGVMVYVEAPAEFEAVNPQRLELLSGRLSANVPPAGIGFTVQTPEAEVVDYGTEFSVDAQSGASEVHVFSGLVRVHSRHATNQRTAAIDLRTAEAIRIEDSPQSPVEIKLAAERFIRDFQEPKRNYPRSMKRLSPVAYYRMPIRDRGLVAEPPQYSGEVLTGDGVRPPHARGVFAGGSLRVRANSTGRGGRVNLPPPLNTGQFALAVFVYVETPSQGGTVATNIQGDAGNFALSLDERGLLRATVRTCDGELQSVVSDIVLPLTTWRHLVVTADGRQLRIYHNGQQVASTPCATMADCESDTMWFGTDADGAGLWDGRIDELAVFDRTLSAREIAGLYQAARDETAKAE